MRIRNDFTNVLLHVLRYDYSPIITGIRNTKTCNYGDIYDHIYMYICNKPESVEPSLVFPLRDLGIPPINP